MTYLCPYPECARDIRLQFVTKAIDSVHRMFVINWQLIDSITRT
jgi:hypothetical protein